MIEKIRTSLNAKLFLATAVLLMTVCLISVFSMARYIPQTYSSRLNAALQKQAHDLIPELENASSLEECYALAGEFASQSGAAVCIKDENGNILYSSDELPVTADKDTIAVVREHSGDTAAADDSLLSEAGYIFTLLNDEYMLCVQNNTVAVNQAAEAVWQTVPVIAAGSFLLSVLFSLFYSRCITKPMIELSMISQKMASLDFETHKSLNRSDEIGILSDNLNILANRLRETLSELKKTNLELEAEILKERELEKKQREFFAAASHELKTPLTILKGHLTGILNQIKGYENHEKYMKRSLAAAEKMETLVKELLYVSRTDGKEKCEYKTVDFAELVRVQTADVTEMMCEKEQRLEADIPDKLLCELEPAQMERAAANVLVNAVRYSPKGELIRVSLSEREGSVYFEVENTGVHIPEDRISHLFEAFYRADTSRSRNTGGTGLGLYIVRKIVELHRGEYGIKNSDRGVLFWLRIPQKRSNNNSI